MLTVQMFYRQIQFGNKKLTCDSENENHPSNIIENKYATIACVRPYTNCSLTDKFGLRKRKDGRMRQDTNVIFIIIHFQTTTSFCIRGIL